MKIRKATKRDIPQMMKIINLNNSFYKKDLAKKELIEMFSKSLLKPTYIVVEVKGKVVAFNGFIPSWVDNNVYNLFWANTHPVYMGQGLQSKLINDIFKRLKQIKNPKAKMILISTKIPNYFKKLGFRKIGIKYDRDYLLMQKKLK